LLVFYVAAVMATGLFGVAFPDWFGSVGASMYSLFQIMTLESWSMGIVRPVMEVYPQAWIFFVPFIVATSFTVLNLFIALIVNSMQTLQSETRQSLRAEAVVAHDEREALGRQLDTLSAEVAALRRRLERERAQFVERTVALANLLQREVASCKEARAVLGIPQLA